MFEAIEKISDFFPVLKSILECLPSGILDFFGLIFTVLLTIGIAKILIRSL